MSCNTQQLNITCGTDVVLHDRLIFEGETFDPNLSVGIAANLVSSLGKRTALDVQVVDDELLISVPWVDGTLPGCYGLEVTGSCNSKKWATYADSLIKYTKATRIGVSEVTIESDSYDITQEVGYCYSNSPVTFAEVTVDDGYGTPSVDVTYEQRVLSMAFHNLKGNGITDIEVDEQVGDEAVNTVTIKTDADQEGTEFQVRNGRRGNGIASSSEQLSDQDGGTNTFTITDDDGNTHEFHSKNGTKGNQGDSAVYNPEDPEAPDFVMANTTGQSTTKAMTQKAVTEAVSIHFDGYELGRTVIDSFIIYGTGMFFRGAGFTKNQTHQLIPLNGQTLLSYKVYSANTYSSYINFYDSLEITQEGWLGGIKTSSTNWFEGTCDLTLYPSAKMVVVSTMTQNLEESYIILHKPVNTSVEEMIADVEQLKSDVGTLEVTVKDYRFEYDGDDFVKNQYYIYPNGNVATDISKNCGRLTLYVGENITNGRITARCGCVDNKTACVAFFSTNVISSENLISMVRLANGVVNYDLEIPEGTSMIIVSNRSASLATPSATLSYTTVAESAVTSAKMEEMELETAAIDKAVNGVGNGNYYGGKIDLNISNVVRKMSSSTIYREEYGEGSSRIWTQSHAMYGGYMFVFLNGGICSVYSFTNGEISWIEDVNIGINAHCNNVQFSDVFYTSSDTFPLLLLSSGNEGVTNNSMYWVRIGYTNGHYTFDAVKTVVCTFPYANNNGCFVANFAAKRMFLYCMKLNYRTVEGNESYIYEVPYVGHDSEVSEITSDDIIRMLFAISPRLIWQGACEYGGKLFMPVENVTKLNGSSISLLGNKGILVINEDTGYVESAIPMPLIEPEGICIYDGKLYLTQRKGGTDHASSDEIFYVTEYTF